jgi:hypothetical protein
MALRSFVLGDMILIALCIRELEEVLVESPTLEIPPIFLIPTWLEIG